MDETAYIQPVMDFVRAHAAWAPLIIMVLTFLESIAFFSLIIPAWGMIVAFGPLIGSAGLSPWPVLAGAAVGAALGDWVSYWFGFHYRDSIAHWWPFSRYPELLPKGHAFFERWGWLSIAIGRFSGPLRASVPLIAGITAMPRLAFQLSNWLSAALWVAVLLLPGFYAGPALKGWLGTVIGWLGAG